MKTNNDTLDIIKYYIENIEDEIMRGLSFHKYSPEEYIKIYLDEALSSMKHLIEALKRFEK